MHGAVFSVWPVQDREHDVEARYRTASWSVAITQHEAASACRDQRDLRCLVRDRERRGARSGAIAGVADKPAAIPGYSDQRNLIPLRVEGPQDVGG